MHLLSGNLILFRYEDNHLRYYVGF